MKKIKIIILSIGILLFVANTIYVPWYLEFSHEGEKKRPLGYHLIFNPPDEERLYFNKPSGVEVDWERYSIQAIGILVLIGGLYSITLLASSKDQNEDVQLEEQAKFLIGVDRIMARKFYIDIPISEIEEKTGEAPYFEKAIVWFSYLIAPVALISSIILIFIGLRWWGIFGLFICPLIYSKYASSSMVDGSKLIFITLLLLTSLIVHFFGDLNVPWITGAATLFIFALWCVRLLYCSSTYLLRAFVIRNEKAFEWLSKYLVIKDQE
mgnify:CR=1 FL=1